MSLYFALLSKKRNNRIKRMRANRRGYYAEYLAAFFLRLKGFRILERRWKTKVGEIDLIAKRGNLILMVEVKARPNLYEAMEAVTVQAERRIESAANLWLAKQSTLDCSIRFDFIAIVPWHLPVHVENFFEGRM